MTHIAMFKDTSGKAVAIYRLEEVIMTNSRVYVAVQCVADKVPVEESELIAAAIRTAYEDVERAALTKPPG
jgi:hypothetical protein